MLGDVGAGNLRLLLQRPRRRYRFRLDRRYCRRGSAGRDTDHLELVKRLAPQEVHVLARTEIGSLSELAGKKVSVGPQGSSSAATATALFKALGITVEPQHLDASTAIERLKQGTIDAAVIVGGKPYPLVSAVPTNSGIHLLPIPFSASLEAAYLPTRIEQHDYPNLIQPGGKVPTVATGMVIARRKGRSSLGGAVAHFVEVLLPRFAELQTSDRHPKWREVNLAASLLGFSRTPAADTWLNERTVETGAKPIAAGPGAVQPASMPDGAMGNGDKEGLFQRFIEWQRSKAH
jgi:uncharacterized protein